MRLASYNFQNLFRRPRVMNSEIWAAEAGTDGSLYGRFAASREVLALYAHLSKILNKPFYTGADKAELRDGLVELGLGLRDDSALVRLRQNKGRLLRRPRTGGLEIVADGRGDWIGWLELELEAVDEKATAHTARVIRDVGADIIGAIEIEDRLSLLRFNEQVLTQEGGQAYDHVMAIDGNDSRGIDVGILSRGRPIEQIRSHVDDRNDAGQRVFCRDCIAYRVSTPSGPLWLLINHFKSKGYGDFHESERRRHGEAARVAEIYRALRADGIEYIAVTGDMNDLKNSDPLKPLFEGTDLRDVSDHPNYVEVDGRRGTFGNCAASDHIDFILLSPALFGKVTGTSVERRGIWGGANGTLFPHYDTITKPAEAASDHALVWVDLDL